MVAADKHFRAYLADYGVRGMLIGQISDDYKSAYGVRPRWNWADMTLVELWVSAKEVYAEAARESERWAELDRMEAEQLAREEEEFRVWQEVRPTKWDTIADKLEGVA